MADKTTYTPETYQTSYVDFYNMGGIDVTKAPDPDPDPDPDPVVRPNVLDPVGGDDNSNIFTGVSLSTGKPAFKVGSVDYNEYIQNFDTNLDNQAKKGEDKSLGGFTKWAAEQLKKPEMMVGTVAGVSMGVPALGGIMAAAGAMNRKKQYENASKIAATGGTGGSMFMVNNQTISRAPGSRIYSGTLGDMSQQQVAAVEAINRNFIPGTMVESEDDDPTRSGYVQTGKSGLVSIDGAIMDAYGNIHSAAGPQMASASQATALREKLYVDAMNAAGYTINKETLAADALAMKQSLNAAAKGGIGFFETVGRQDAGTYNSNLSGSQKFIQNYLAERHQEKEAAPADEGLPPTVIAAQEAAAQPPSQQDSSDDSSPAGTPTEYSISQSGFQGGFDSGAVQESTSQTQSSYEAEAYGGGYFADGGRVGLQMGGTPGAPAGFVERPPSQVSEAATVADDKPMSVPEGTFVINAAAVEFAGEEDIADMLKKAYVKAGKKDMGGPSTQEIDIAVSRGEVIVPAHIAKIIGYDRLEKINNRGKAETSKRIEENGQQPTGAAEGGFLSRLFGFGKEEPQLTRPQPDPQENTQVTQEAPSQGFVEQPAAEPSTPLPPLTGFENTARDLLIRLEGNTTTGYVPAGKSKSGVTVGIGFDIGQHNPTDLEKMGLNTSLIAKLTPYLKKKGKAATDALDIVPLELSESELEEVNKIVIRKKYEEFENKFPKYASIPDDGKRAVMFSTAYIGGLNRYKTFREEFDKAQNLKRAIRVGLFGKMNRGDAEYNRAKKALDWYNEYELENMQRPTPKPNSSATR